MSPQEIEKLLGGYATDTLTEEERRTLFEAALGNQALFDALADEQALRELLLDPAGRAQLLGVLRDPKPSGMAWMAAWLRRPSILAQASAVAAGIIVTAVISPEKLKKAPLPAEVAMTRRTEPAPQPGAPEPKPAQHAAPRRPAPRVAPTPAPAPKQETRAAESKTTDNAVQVTAAAPAVAAPAALPPPPPAVPAAAPQPSAVSGFVTEQKIARAAKRQAGPAAFGSAVSRISTLPGVRYSILKRDADGSFAEADPAGVFAPGDALRLRIEANQPGNLAVMERQPDGSWSLRMTARVREGEPVFMPSESAIEIRRAVELHFFVRFSRTLQPAARMDQVTPSPGLMRNKVGNSMVVNRAAPAADAGVEFEITIVAK